MCGQNSGSRHLVGFLQSNHFGQIQLFSVDHSVSGHHHGHFDQAGRRLNFITAPDTVFARLQMTNANSHVTRMSFDQGLK